MSLERPELLLRIFVWVLGYLDCKARRFQGLRKFQGLSEDCSEEDEHVGSMYPMLWQGTRSRDYVVPGIYQDTLLRDDMTVGFDWVIRPVINHR